jgi:hypothetical protein
VKGTRSQTIARLSRWISLLTLSGGIYYLIPLAAGASEPPWGTPTSRPERTPDRSSPSGAPPWERSPDANPPANPPSPRSSPLSPGSRTPSPGTETGVPQNLSQEQAAQFLKDGGLPMTAIPIVASEEKYYATIMTLLPYMIYLCDATQPQCSAGEELTVSTFRVQSDSMDSTSYSMPVLQQVFGKFARSVLAKADAEQVNVLLQRINEATSQAFSTRGGSWTSGEQGFTIDMTGLENLEINAKILITTAEPSRNPGVMALQIELK